jgi:hypothetical protein
MKSFTTLLGILVLTLPASAHSVWIVPDKAAPTKATVVFSDSLAPDENPKILDKIAGAKLWLRAEGGDKPVEWTRKEKFFELALPGRNVTVGGVNNYGVVQRGDAKPFLLIQCPKLVLGNDDKAWDKLPLELAPTRNGSKVRLTVFFKGKPAPAGLDIAVLNPDGSKGTALKTDDKGQAELDATAQGFYGLTVRHTLPEAGTIDGKKFDETRYSASLVLAGGEAKGPAGVGKADPEAVRLLEEARMARAHWRNFPGFAADLAVESDGRTATGKVIVGADYKLALDGFDKDTEAAVQRELGSTVGHRRDTSGEPTPPCVFDPAGDNALGRSVRILGDKFESAYRIRDKELTVVQRTMPNQKFTILTLENVKNAEGKLLPSAHVVQYFDNKTGVLVKSDANFHTYKRVGEFDLPATALKMTTTPDAPVAQVGPKALRLTLTNHRLLERAAQK